MFTRFFAIAALFLFGLAWPSAAQAHARLLRSEPAKDAVVTASPTLLEFWFNELLDDSFNSVAVFPAADLGAAKRAEFTAGKPTVDRADRTRLTVKLKPLPPGEYIVEWRVLSRDGHTAPGRFTIRIQPR